MGLETIELVQQIEEDYNIALPDEDLADISVVGEFCLYVANEVNVIGEQELELEDVFAHLVVLLESKFDVPAGSVTLKSHFVSDLGLD